MRLWRSRGASGVHAGRSRPTLTPPRQDRDTETARGWEPLVQKTSLTALGRTELRLALAATSGRSSRTVYGGHEHLLRQTLIALRAGEAMSEHENPGEATLQVLHGRVRLAAGIDVWTVWTGDLVTIPDARHSLEALEDSTVLLTVVKHR